MSLCVITLIIHETIIQYNIHGFNKSISGSLICMCRANPQLITFVHVLSHTTEHYRNINHIFVHLWSLKWNERHIRRSAWVTANVKCTFMMVNSHWTFLVPKLANFMFTFTYCAALLFLTYTLYIYAISTRLRVYSHSGGSVRLTSWS